ncbi:MAG: transcriptional repressor LexA [Planctomycetota bacterium]|jgi:repressor LexA
MKALTEKQSEILDFLVECIRDEHYTPTVREIADHFGIKSTNAVRNHLDAIERKGYLSRKPGASRSIELSDETLGEPGGVPIVGRVAAGLPITAAENLDGYLSFDNLFAQSDNLYALRVHGDSMIDAGIWDGDFVIVRQQPTVDEGEIAVAIVDEEATVKKIRRQGKIIELIPANESYRPIEVDPDTTPFRIGGKVVGIHRTL